MNKKQHKKFIKITNISQIFIHVSIYIYIYIYIYRFGLRIHES